MSHYPSASRQVKILGATANTTVIIPASHVVEQIVIENVTANAVTGGIRIGTTDGGSEVMIALAVGANAFISVLDAAMLKKIFSMTADQTLYVQAAVLWNSAVVNFYFITTKVG